MKKAIRQVGKKALGQNHFLAEKGVLLKGKVLTGE